MLRTLVGLAAGLAVAILTIMIVETIGHQLFPPPRGFDMTLESAMALPFANLIWPVLAWFLGSARRQRAGGLHLGTSAGPAGRSPRFVLVGTIFNFALITHPLWMMIAGVDCAAPRRLARSAAGRHEPAALPRTEAA